MQTGIAYVAYLVIPPDALRWPSTGAALSLLFGAVILFFWLRDNFANLTAPIAKEMSDLFGIDLHLRANNLVHPVRYSRARWAYVVSIMTLYLVLCLLGVEVAQRAGIVGANWVNALPSHDAFPLFLAVAIVSASALLPHVVNVEALVRTAMHRHMAIPLEIDKARNFYYEFLASAATTAQVPDEKLTPPQGNSADPAVIDGGQVALYATARSLLDRLISIQSAAAAETWSKLAPYADTVSSALDALKLKRIVEGNGNDDCRAGFAKVMRNGALLVACLISATPRDKRGALLAELELPEYPSDPVTWHETLSAQFICFVILMAVFTIAGLVLATTLMDVQTIFYSWIFPESLPLILAYLVFFAFFSELPGERTPSARSTYARFSLGLVVAFACAVAARTWWLLTSVVTLPANPLYGEGAILALGSVGAAAIAIVAHNLIFRQNGSRKSLKIAAVSFASFILCGAWSGATAWAHLRLDESARIEYSAPLQQPTKPWWPLVTATFPACIVLSLLTGTVLVGRRRQSESGKVSGVPQAPAYHPAAQTQGS